MKILLPSMKWLVLGGGLFGFGALDWIWSNNLCDNFIHILFFGVALALQFYLVVEYASKFIDSPIEIDLRSEDQKEMDEFNRRRGLVEAAKENLLMQVATARNVNPEDVDQAVLKLEAMNTILQVPIGLPSGNYDDDEEIV